MKKIIESDLISIAHRILKLKDKAEISALLKETQLLQNKLILLQFYEENKFRLDASLTPDKLLEAVNVNDNNEETSDSISNIEMQDSVVTCEESLMTPIHLDVDVKEFAGNDDVLLTDDEVDTFNELSENDDFLDTEEEIDEELIATEEEVIFTPSIEETQKTIYEIEEEIEELEHSDPMKDVKEAVERATIEIDPVFSVPHTEIFKESVAAANVAEKDLNANATQHFFTNNVDTASNENYRQAPINKSINDAFAHKIAIGLNDRIAFEKNLFNGNGDDLNRVIAQLNTIESYQEAKDFIEDLVKPDFNDWKGKEDYETRFMELVEKRFL